MPQSHPDGTIIDGPGGSLIMRGGQWVPLNAPSTAGAPIVTHLADPARAYAAPTAAEQLRHQRLENDRLEHPQATAPAGFRFKANGDLEPIPGGPSDPARPNRNNTVTPQVRATAIGGYRASQQLNQLTDQIEQLYQQGPGATHGLAGLADYNPFSTINQRFNTAGNSVRGLVGQALGFTGGQLNTEREAAASIGPYLPQAGDRDEVIQDKITRLRQLAGTAQQRAVEQLGGVPDEGGNIVPVQQQATPPAAATNGNPPSTLPDGPQGGMAAATTTRTEFNPQADAVINRMILAGADASQINAQLAQNGWQDRVDPQLVQSARQWNNGPQGAAWRRANPGQNPSFSRAQRDVPVTEMQRLSATPGAALLAQAGNAVTGGLIGSIGGQQALNVMDATHPIASTTGTLAGGALAAAGLEGAAGLAGAGARWAPRIGDAAYGALSGFNSAGDGEGLQGAAIGALSGLGGGIFGRAATRTAGRLARGVTNPEVSYLAQRGVPLTVGQTVRPAGIAGRAIAGIEDRLAGLPVVGDIVNARRREGFQGFNRAAFNEALAPIGGGQNQIGEQGVEAAQQAVGQGYDRTLSGVNVPMDQQFLSDTTGAIARGRGVPTYGADFGQIIDHDVLPITGAANSITGPQFQQATRTLAGNERTYRRIGLGTAMTAPAPMATRVAGEFGNMDDALTGLIGRQSPATLPAYEAANTAFRRTGIVRDAVDAARHGTQTGEGGVFTPAQLTNASRANARTFGRTQGTTNQPFFELTRAAQAVLPSTVPDSGTAGRLAIPAALGVLGGGGAGIGYAGGDAQTGGEAGLGAGALLALGGTRSGQRALTHLLLTRPDLARRIGTQVYNGSRIGGMFGAGIAAPIAGYLGQ